MSLLPLSVSQILTVTCYSFVPKSTVEIFLTPRWVLQAGSLPFWFYLHRNCSPLNQAYVSCSSPLPPIRKAPYPGDCEVVSTSAPELRQLGPLFELYSICLTRGSRRLRALLQPGSFSQVSPFELGLRQNCVYGYHSSPSLPWYLNFQQQAPIFTTTWHRPRTTIWEILTWLLSCRMQTLLPTDLNYDSCSWRCCSTICSLCRYLPRALPQSLKRMPFNLLKSFIH